MTTNVASGSDLLRLFHEADPVEPGHLEVGEHDLGGEFFELSEGLESVGGGLSCVAFVAKDFGERRTGVRLVVDDQNAAPVGHYERALALTYRCETVVENQANLMLEA